MLPADHLDGGAERDPGVESQLGPQRQIDTAMAAGAPDAVWVAMQHAGAEAIVGAPGRVVQVVAAATEEDGLVDGAGRVPERAAWRPGGDEGERAALRHDAGEAGRRGKGGLAGGDGCDEDDPAILIGFELLAGQRDD